MTDQPNTASNPRDQNATILIYLVDDEPLIGEVVEAVLTLEGYRITFFQDPTVALQEFLKADPKPQLLLADFVMRPMTGMELIERCKQAQPALKTILYSGNVGEEIMESHSVRPDAFLNKPFLPRKLIDLVKSVLAK